jgi:hypothetical protein
MPIREMNPQEYRDLLARPGERSAWRRVKHAERRAQPKIRVMLGWVPAANTVRRVGSHNDVGCGR